MINFPFRSADGNSLLVCSTDGYCTIASFAEGELGKAFTGDSASSTAKTENEIEVILRIIFSALIE